MLWMSALINSKKEEEKNLIYLEPFIISDVECGVVLRTFCSSEAKSM
jgi:hypothetical protein